MNIVKIIPTVKELLMFQPVTRDNDEMLILKVWAEQVHELRSRNYKYIDFARLFVGGRLHKPESIRRTRQKLQEEFPELRGKSYHARHNHQQSVKDQINQPEFHPGGTP